MLTLYAVYRNRWRPKCQGSTVWYGDLQGEHYITCSKDYERCKTCSSKVFYGGWFFLDYLIVAITLGLMV